MKDCHSKKEVTFYYINFSEFHGNGQVILLARDGTVWVQIVQSPFDFSYIYQFQLGTKQHEDFSKQLLAINPANLKVNDRVGIPDEVTVQSGLRDSQLHWHHVKVWETDWSKQNSDVKTLQLIAQKIIDLAKKQKPKVKDQIANGVGKRSRPANFDVNDFWQ